VAKMPADQNCTAEAFWQALLATAWVTGMRKSALMSLLWPVFNSRFCYVVFP